MLPLQQCGAVWMCKQCKQCTGSSKLGATLRPYFLRPKLILFIHGQIFRNQNCDFLSEAKLFEIERNREFFIWDQILRNHPKIGKTLETEKFRNRNDILYHPPPQVMTPFMNSPQFLCLRNCGQSIFTASCLRLPLCFWIFGRCWSHHNLLHCQVSGFLCRSKIPSSSCDVFGRLSTPNMLHPRNSDLDGTTLLGSPFWESGWGRVLLGSTKREGFHRNALCLIQAQIANSAMLHTFWKWDCF